MLNKSEFVQRRAGPKGFGLFTNQKLSAGDFIIEYVGEVSVTCQSFSQDTVHR